MLPSSFYYVAKKIFKEENIDSLKKEQEVSWSYSQAKLQLYQVGFNLSSQALTISSLRPCPHSPFLLLRPVLNISLRKLSQISQLQYNKPFSFPLQSFLPGC